MSRQKPCLFVALLLSAGCGGAADGPVSGRVTLDGRPLAKAHVYFYPRTKNDEALFYLGRTDPEGRYALKSVKDDVTAVQAGVYRVSLTTAVVENADESSRPPKEMVPQAYRDEAHEYQVPEGGTTQANFELKTK
jgi:hypothetical protein